MSSRQLDANQPIGVFDSGIGGLTVANAIHRCLPEEQLIYFGDTAHLPYGDKSADAIRYYCLKIAKFLVDRQCKMIVVACNSASSAGYKVLLEFFKQQSLFVNVVDPLVAAVAGQPFRKVGLIATKATVHSGMYQAQLSHLNPELEVAALPTPLLAPMIEEGLLHNKVSRTVLETYLSDPALKDIEALMLACTHYPLIRDDIDRFYQHGVAIFDSTDVVAGEVRKRLAQRGLLSAKRREPHSFYVSDYTQSFEDTTRLFYKEKIHLEYCPIW